MKKPLKYGTFLHTLLLLLIGMMVGVGSFLLLFPLSTPSQGLSSNNLSSAQKNLSTKLTFINQLLNTEYLDPEKLSTAEEEMTESALKAYVAGLDDPYTNYLTKEENTELVHILHDETGISGIGAVVEKRDNYVQIAEVIKNGPAYKAGLQPLDRIFFIETGSTQDLTVNEAVEQIRGPQGSTVNLFIQRAEKDGTTKEFRITITRNTIEIPSVVTTLITTGNTKIGLFEISSISEHTTKLFINDLVELKQQEMAGMIIDLRGNGGGYLEEAAKFLGHFIPKGEIVVKSEYQAFRPVDLPSEGRGELSTIPTVIIIDQLTASAGEIIALTLQEKGIPIIGMPSFGKGTIQAFTELPDGSSLKYTIGKRFSPAHTSINETGVLPDTTVERKSDVYLASGFDTQLEAAKIELQKLIEKKQRI